VGLSEGVRTIVLLRLRWVRSNGVRTRNICERWSHYVEGKGVITQGKKQNDTMTHADPCMPSTRTGGVV